MPSAWEEPGLSHNLGVLGRLAGRQDKAKLKFDLTTGRFDIDERHVISRTFSSDSVTSGSHFATPMKGLLRVAQERLEAGLMTQAAFDAAVNGLVRLRTTYSDTPAKVQALDEALKTVRGLAPLARDRTGKGEVVVKLRERHRRNLVYAVRQRNYLDVGQADVCHSFVIDWGRRILASKLSYGQSKKSPGGYEPAAELSRSEHVRLQKKVDRVVALQAEEQARLSRHESPRRAFPAGTKFGRVQISGADKMQAGDFLPTTTGRQVFDQILKKARLFAPSASKLVLMVRLDGASAGGSHMMGLHLSEGGLNNIHLFDPNVGEFRFMRGADEHLWDLCDDLLTSLYTTTTGNKRELIFNSFVIDRIELNPWR